MKAMILAAGKGTRVRPITYTIPKPMIPILQKPVMEFLVELLRHHGFDQIMDELSMDNWLGKPSALRAECDVFRIFHRSLMTPLWCSAEMR
jgi:CTP:molybdopterin cytidylyltransferase MocA